MNAWIVIADERRGRALRDYLMRSGSVERARVETSPWRARSLLAGELEGYGAMVGEGADGPDAVNVAAALVADGHAGEVVLAVEQASGSLRSRAKRAGIARVITSEDLAARPASALPGAEGASLEVDHGRAAGKAAVSDEMPPVREPAACAPSRRPGGVRRGDAPVLCFVSGRGGVGKSVVCALAGHIAAGWGLRVGLLDLDLAFGNLFALCGLERPCDLTPAADEPCSPETIDACGRQAAEGLRVWGPCASPEHAELVQPAVEQIVAHLTRACDLVLVDTTTNWGDAVACAAQMADRLVIVSDERPGAVPALARCGALAVRLGVARTRIVRLMNGCDARGRDDAYVTRAAQGLECAREVRVLDGGEEAGALLAAGHAAELAALDNPLATSLATGLAQVLRELGRLPEGEGPARALEGRRRPRSFLGRRKEVA